MVEQGDPVGEREVSCLANQEQFWLKIRYSLYNVSPMFIIEGYKG